MPKYSREHEIAVRTALIAARQIREQAGNVCEEEIREKGYKDLVTSVDEKVERFIIRSLGDAFPNYGFLAEESEERVVATKPCWIIDPIDGTVNFSHGLPPYAVSIALEADGKIQVGVVVEASSQDVFSAVRGKGATRNGEPIHTSRRLKLEDSLIATGLPYKDFISLPQIIEVLTRFMKITRGVRRFGSAAVDLAYVACGLFDGFYESGLKVWDMAAGALLVEEAGGMVSCFGGKSDYLNGGQIMASNGKIHHQMLEALAPMR